jgi:RNase P subunit RPR2
MTFRGKREPGIDYFDDFTENNEKAGVFEGTGFDDYEGVKESVSPEGVKVRMSCRKCGQAHELTLEWQELFVVGSNGPGKALLKPRGWEYSENNGALFPTHVFCKKCREPLCPQVTPDEARARVNDAISRNLVPMGQAHQWQAEVASWRGQGA